MYKIEYECKKCGTVVIVEGRPTSNSDFLKKIIKKKICTKCEKGE